VSGGALVIVGGPGEAEREEALRAFEAAGWARALEVQRWEGADRVLAVRDAAALREADARGVRYVLVHNGPDDGEPGGTYARAHHRVAAAELAGLARRLRSRERLLVTCLAFAYRNGIPDGCSWVVDARCLDNPYWVPELRPLDGRDPRVRAHVLGQAAARRLLDGLQAALEPLLPEYRARGRAELTVGFGCTGGRHRSVALAGEMARRLAGVEGVDVAVAARELEGAWEDGPPARPPR
jgi:P-loop ATPase protein family